MRPMRRVYVLLIASALWVTEAQAQATYKLEVKPFLKPLASLQLQGDTITRTPLKDDPGFRLQYSFKKDGKPLTIVEARSSLNVPIPDKTPGIYSVTLELFFPSYKTGDVQKGQFKQISEELTYQIKVPAKSGESVHIALLTSKPLRQAALALGKPTLIVQCGKGSGAAEKELISAGYGYKLIRGKPFDGWKPPAGKSHAWIDPQNVQFELTVPAQIEGVLRLHHVDGDGSNLSFRYQNLLVEGKKVATHAVFHGPGVFEDVNIAANDTKDGKIEVNIANIMPKLSAVISTIEFIPAEKK